jgi:tRNA (mo5U34)-methyltransferase
MTLQSTGHDLGPWFHNLHLPDGTQTAPDHPLGDFPRFKWQVLAPSLPADLTGRRALDIGCNAGFYSFELAGRGAHVLGVDHDPHYLAQAAWARERFGLHDRVELRELAVYDVHRLQERFDLVLFMGVLYHLRHPLLALDLVADRVADGGTLVLQTLTTDRDDGPQAHVPADLPLRQRERLHEPGWPKLAFVEHQLAGDATNWWIPNPPAVEAMVRSTGLEIASHPAHETWLCRRPRR